MGEGGGQILRTALSLSVCTGRSMRIENIRRARPRPGLKPQHLRAVEAAAAISNAEVSGAKPGSQSLRFAPRGVRAGDYHFAIGTAGSAPLVLQTLALPLGLLDQSSRVTITGGTHVPWSPCYHFLALHWLRYLHHAGYRIGARMPRAGFYPPGGGEIDADIAPRAEPYGLQLTERGRLRAVRGVSAGIKVPVHVARRQRDQARQRLDRHGVEVAIDIERPEAVSPGSYLVLIAEFEHVQWCGFALGARGKPAERVADEVVAAFEAYLESGAAVDRHLADQLLAPLSVIPVRSRLSVEAVTGHLTTNAAVIEQLLPARVRIEGETGAPGTVEIEGVSL